MVNENTSTKTDSTIETEQWSSRLVMRDQIKNGMTRQMSLHGRDEPQWRLAIQHKMESLS